MSARKQVDAVIKAMAERPDDFHIGKSTMDDNRSDMRFWIGNGFTNYGVYQPFESSFGFYHGFRLWRAVRVLNTMKTQQYLNRDRQV
tara:strand:+ start:20274 stop:20534 length:261 start_codon:yes stop_codon:yes gene_type:complete